MVVVSSVWLQPRRMKQPRVREAWVTKSVYTTRTKLFTKVPVNNFFQEMKPLLILQRALGRFPYSFNEQGLAPFKILSFLTLYTATFFIVQSIWTIHSMIVIGNMKIYSAPSYDVALFWVSIGLILLLNLTTPITKWIDAGKQGEFISSWQDFQTNHMNSELEMSLSLPIKMISALIVPTALLFMGLENYLLSDIPFLANVPFITAMCAAGGNLVHWCATLYELRAASRFLLKKIIRDGYRNMATHRRSWLELSKLVAAVGDSHALTGIMMAVIFFTSLILCTYTVLSSLFEPTNFQNHFWGLLVGAILGFICIFIIFDSAHKTTQEVGPNFSSKILTVDLNNLSQNEINETMTAHPPLIGYLGFVTINRNLFVAMISNVVTYLVVLVQFKSSSPLTTIDEDDGVQ